MQTHTATERALRVVMPRAYSGERIAAVLNSTEPSVRVVVHNSTDECLPVRYCVVSQNPTLLVSRDVLWPTPSGGS